MTRDDYRGSGYTKEEFDSVTEIHSTDPDSEDPDQYGSDLEKWDWRT